MFLPFPIVLLISNLFAGWIAKGTNLRPLMVVGLSVGAAGYWLLHSIEADTSYLQMLPGFVVIPLGVGLALPWLLAIDYWLFGSEPKASYRVGWQKQVFVH
jgi:DHA2 family methylenomycin A resistance protein-like MFS transporter